MPLWNDKKVVLYTYPVDPYYLVLPFELYKKIWLDNMQKYQYKAVLFDCGYPISPPSLPNQKDLIIR